MAGDDLRLVLLAALAWLQEHDTGGHADSMDAEIDKDELARVIDRLTGTPRAPDVMAIEALDVIEQHGQTDGDHHKAWVIDQVLRALTGTEYDAWVAAYEQDGEYEWDQGVAP